MAADGQQPTPTEDEEITAWINQIHEGDALDVLDELPESSVHCVVTSTPYWGLRDYQKEDQIGLEPTVEEFVDQLVTVGRKLRRVLRPDGSWWLNLGDTYAGGGGVAGKPDDHDDLHNDETYPDDPPARRTRFKRKTKLFVPHRVAIALIDDGWVSRSDVPWTKKGTPHPAADRLRTAHEFVFHLAPQPDYWHDGTALDEWGVFDIPPAQNPDGHYAVMPEEVAKLPIRGTCPAEVCVVCGAPVERVTTEIEPWNRDPATIERPQLRRALEIAERSDLSEAHLRACRSFGFADAGYGTQQTGENAEKVERLAGEAKEVLNGYFREFATAREVTTGLERTCDCDTDETAPGIVLDPFAGTGTTCRVAKRLGRRFIGIELNEEYVAVAQQRVGIDVDDPDLLTDDGQRGLAAYTDGGER
jgi:DNA modification methylase